MATFTSSGGFYLVECPQEKSKSFEAYVNRVETFLPILREVFPLKPSYDRLTVVVGVQRTRYELGGTVYLKSDIDVNNPKEIYGGLFHETIHGFLESYVYRQNGRNEITEACVIVVQVAALDRINMEWANIYAGGCGCNVREHPLLFELVRIYREYGFEPIKAVYSAMNASDAPVLREESFLSDLNNILGEHGVTRPVVL